MNDQQEKPEVEKPAAPEKEKTTTRAKATPKRKTKKSTIQAIKEMRGQSSIAFPYQDLETAISVARAIMGAGGVALTREQLAGVLGQTVGSGSFVTKVATTRTFGLIDFVASKYELTDLGHAILDKNERTQKAARAQAFLYVPLYKRVYEEFRGRQLPPRPNGLEQAMVTFGVAAKQKTNARLAFDKSANQAGFFPAGNERLIEPIMPGPAGPTGPAGTSTIGGAGPNGPLGPQGDGEGGGYRQNDTQSGGYDLHPFIQGLLDSLPEPGTNWAIEGRSKWLQTAANIFDLIYKGSGEIEITSKPGKSTGEAKD